MANFFFNRPVHQSQKLVTYAQVEPVTLDQLKLQCRVDSDITQDDDLITGMGIAARSICEKYIKRAFISQSWQLNLDAFPFWRNWNLCGSPIQLIRPPVQSIVSLQFLDSAGDLKTIDPSLYTLDTTSEPGRVIRNNSQPWPICGFFPNSVQIVTLNGYGNSASDVPQQAINAILMHAAWQYRNRGDQDNMTAPPQAIWDMLDTLNYGGVW